MDPTEQSAHQLGLYLCRQNITIGRTLLQPCTAQSCHLVLVLGCSPSVPSRLGNTVLSLVVASDVVLQTDIMVKSPVAELALKGLLPCVDTQVRLQLASLSKCTITHLTLEWLVFAVRQLMPHQLVVLSKFLVADLTANPFLVLFKMTISCQPFSEFLWAFWTLIGLCS